MHGRANGRDGEPGRDLETRPFRNFRKEHEMTGRGHRARETLQALVLTTAICDAVQYDPGSVVLLAIVPTVNRRRQRFRTARECALGDLDDARIGPEVLSQEAQRCT